MAARWPATARAAGGEHVTAHSGRVGLTSELDEPGHVLRGVPRRPRHGVGRPAAAQPLPGVEPRGLLKVEQLHALARAVYYGQRGRISAREVYDQVNACSCLTLILACIVYWQAREISRLAAAPDFPFDPDLLRHVSPIEWKNVILYGEIKIDPAKLTRRRP